ncbi:MAG: hypothetical protein WBK51_14500 [Polaromonas sp.]
MRTTRNIDDDVLLAARAIARRDKKTVGQVISELGQITLDRQLSGLVSKALPNRVGLWSKRVFQMPKRIKSSRFREAFWTVDQ